MGDGGHNYLNAFTCREDLACRFKTGWGGDSLNSWSDISDHNHGKFADALTNPDYAFGLDVGPVNQTADIWPIGVASTLTSDALVDDLQCGFGAPW